MLSLPYNRRMYFKSKSDNIAFLAMANQFFVPPSKLTFLCPWYSFPKVTKCTGGSQFYLLKSLFLTVAAHQSAANDLPKSLIWPPYVNGDSYVVLWQKRFNGHILWQYTPHGLSYFRLITDLCEAISWMNAYLIHEPKVKIFCRIHYHGRWHHA